jgi:hypothetical protein
VNPSQPRSAASISGQPYSEALKGINESDASASQDNPKAATAGTATGTGLQLAAPIGGAAKSVGVASRALQAAKIGAGFGAAQGAGDALTAGGGVTDALALARRAARQAPCSAAQRGRRARRCFAGLPSESMRGSSRTSPEAKPGARPRARLSGNMVAKAGDDERKAAACRIDDVGFTKSLATKAGAKPAKALADVERVLDQNETKLLGPVYQAIDKAGTGPDATKLGTQLLEHADKLRAAGSPEQAAAIDRYVKFLGRTTSRTRFSPAR